MVLSPVLSLLLGVQPVARAAGPATAEETETEAEASATAESAADPEAEDRPGLVRRYLHQLWMRPRPTASPIPSPTPPSPSPPRPASRWASAASCSSTRIGT